MTHTYQHIPELSAVYRNNKYVKILPYLSIKARVKHTKKYLMGVIENLQFFRG